MAQDKVSVKLNQARNFCDDWDKRNTDGNLSSGFVLSRLDDVANLVEQFKLLDTMISKLGPYIDM